MEMQIYERRERLFRALSDVGGDLIDTAETRRFSAGAWRKWLPVAACMTLLVGLSLLALPVLRSGEEPEAAQIIEQSQQFLTDTKGTVPEETIDEPKEGYGTSGGQAYAAENWERLVIQGMIYYVQACYKAEDAELGTYLGTVTGADNPELVGAAVYAGGEPKEGQKLPLVVFVEHEGDYLYCLTYYAWDGPLCTAQDVQAQWEIGKWDWLLQHFAVPDVTFEEAAELTAEELLEFFLATLQLERAVGRRTTDLDRFLWSQQDVYVIPAEDVRNQLDRYLQGYVLNPAELEQYDPAVDAFILPVLAVQESSVYLMPEQGTVFEAETGVLTLVVSAYEDDDCRLRLYTRTYTIRLDEDGCYFEHIRETP